MLRQGNPPARLLFNITLQAVVHSFEVNLGGIIFNKMRQMQVCADDVVIIGRSPLTVKEAFQRLERRPAKYDSV